VLLPFESASLGPASLHQERPRAAPGDYLLLEVAESGGGIPAADLERKLRQMLAAEPPGGAPESH